MLHLVTSWVDYVGIVIFVLFNWTKTSYWFFCALAGFLITYIF